jgi:hypothetical protein
MKRRPRRGRLPFLVLVSEKKQSELLVAWPVWESGKPVFGFPLFHPGYAGRWECGNLALLARFPRDGGKRGKAAFAFPRFPRARHFHGLFRRSDYAVLGATGDSILHRLNNCPRAAAILRARSVSLIFNATSSSRAKLRFGFKYFSASAKDFHFSYGVA